MNDIDLDGFSMSLGLASTPNLRFLKSAARDRSEFRQNKNVNRKLQKLKEQIKAEKLAKKLEKMGNVLPAQQNQTESMGSDDDEAKSDDELLVTKSTDGGEDDDDSVDLPDAGVHEVTKSRHSKRISVEGQGSKHVIFNDDGEEEDLSQLLMKPGSGTEIAAKDKRELEEATDSYLEKVRARLEVTKDRDEADQKERIRQKHKKRRLEDKKDREDGGKPLTMDITLGKAVEGSSSKGDSSSDSSDSESVSSSGSSSSQEDGPDLKTQEDMALALIRGS